jgi:DNA polymerase-4
MEVFYRYTPMVEPISIDEAFLDVSSSIAVFGTAPEIAAEIKREVLEETGLTISAGVATQKHIAKIASGLNKPDALNVVREGDELKFLWPMDLKKLWGAGKSTIKTLNSLGLKTIGDLAAFPMEKITRTLGENGKRLWELSNGIDDREVIPEREAKSVGAEETFDTDIYGEDKVLREFLSLSFKVSGRLRKEGFKGKTVTIKLRDGKFKTITRSRTLEDPIDDHGSLFSVSKSLIPPGKWGPYRLLGVQVSSLSGENGEEEFIPRINPLFDTGIPSLPKTDPRLTEALDIINDKFGSKTLAPATLLGKPKKRVPEEKT